VSVILVNAEISEEVFSLIAIKLMSSDQSFYTSATGHFKLPRFKEKAGLLKQKLLIIHDHMFLTATFFKNSETFSRVNLRDV
jgi:hypothetical protein